MISILDQHSRKVFSTLPKENNPSQYKNLKEQLLDALPKNFNRAKYLEISKTIGINPKTAEGYIAQFIDKGFLNRPKNNHYINTLISEKDLHHSSLLLCFFIVPENHSIYFERFFTLSISLFTRLSLLSSVKSKTKEVLSVSK